MGALEEARQEHLEDERYAEAHAHRQALQAKRSLPETVDKILRYKTTIDRQLYRAITELEKLQAARGARRRPVESPDVAGLTQPESDRWPGWTCAAGQLEASPIP